jgi:hypothetical protein
MKDYVIGGIIGPVITANRATCCPGYSPLLLQ